MSLPVIEAVLAVYHELDVRTADVRAASGLACPPGCGACCASDEVQATLLEMLPLAWHLAQRTDFEEWIERARAAPSQCLFHTPDGPGPGCCSIYPWRPTLCRLFGFAARRNKHGQREMVICRVAKSALPEAAAQARGLLAAGVLDAPGFGEFAERVAGIEPRLGETRLPINEALAAALEWLWLRRQLGAPPFDVPPNAGGQPPVNHPRAA